MQVRGKLLKWVLIYFVAFFTYGYSSIYAQEATHNAMHDPVTSFAIFAKNVRIDNFAMDINYHCSVLQRVYLFSSDWVWIMNGKGNESLRRNCGFCYSYIGAFFRKIGPKRVFLNGNNSPMGQINCRRGATVFDINGSDWPYLCINNLGTSWLVSWYLHLINFRWINNVIDIYTIGQNPRSQLFFSYVFKNFNIFDSNLSAYSGGSGNLFHCSSRTNGLIDRFIHGSRLVLRGFPKLFSFFPQSRIIENKQDSDNNEQEIEEYKKPVSSVIDKSIVPMMFLFSCGFYVLVLILGNYFFKLGFERFSFVFVFVGLFIGAFGWILIILFCAYKDGWL